MPRGFGKPSTWVEVTKDVSQEMRQAKRGQRVYEQLRRSSEANDLLSAFEAYLKSRHE